MPPPQAAHAVRFGLLAGACLFAFAELQHWHAVSTAPLEPVAAPQADDDAQCGCGEEKLARVAAETLSFTTEVGALEHRFLALSSSCLGASACADRDAVAASLAKDQRACRQRQLAPDMPMSHEMQQWAEACRRVADLSARFAKEVPTSNVR